MVGGSAADRSVHFARREAAWVLRCVLQGDARARAAASIKSLIYSPSVRNKKATFALVCQTLKCKHSQIAFLALSLVNFICNSENSNPYGFLDPITLSYPLFSFSTVISEVYVLLGSITLVFFLNFICNNQSLMCKLSFVTLLQNSHQFATVDPNV